MIQKYISPGLLDVKQLLYSFLGGRGEKRLKLLLSRFRRLQTNIGCKNNLNQK